MKAIAVDDEILMLGALVKAISASPDIAEVTKFSDCEEALDFVTTHSVDIAFLDIICVVWADLRLPKKL